MGQGAGEGMGSGREAGEFGRGFGDANMKDFTMKIHQMSSRIRVTVRIAAEVIEEIGVGICGKPCAERGPNNERRQGRQLRCLREKIASTVDAALAILV